MPPYPETAGGCVLSATIDMYAYSTLTGPTQSDEFEVESPDLGTVFRMESRSERAGGEDASTEDSRSEAPNRSDLVQAVLKEFPGREEHLRSRRLVLHSDAPPGSGLGSSSALIVAMTATLCESTGEVLGPYEIAARAAKIERDNMEIPGGLQDHYAAAFGGFNFIEFDVEGALVHPLALRSETLDELHASLVLCYTGTTRLSGHILERQIEGYRTKNEQSIEALGEIKQIAIDMRAALLKGRLRDFAEGLAAGWEAKKRLAEGITVDEIDDLYQFGLEHGAVAGKVLGAGGGGYFLFFCPVEKVARLRSALEQRGNRVTPFSFETRGVQTWHAPYS